MSKKQRPSLKKSESSKYILFTALISSLLFLNSCASNEESAEDRTKKCREDLETAKAKYDAEDYWKVIPDLEDFVGNCTGTGFVEDAQWMLAQSQYKQENYLEARGEFGSFAINFPGSPKAEEAMFLKAVCSYSMEYRDNRDAENTESALRDLENFVQSYSSSKFLDSAEAIELKLHERRAEMEFQTAQLYMRMKEPQAAAIYFKEIMSEFPEGYYYQNSLVNLIECYIRLEQFTQASYFIDRAKSEFKDDELLKKAHDLESDLKAAQEDFEERIEREKKQKKYIKADEG